METPDEPPDPRRSPKSGSGKRRFSTDTFLATVIGGLLATLAAVAAASVTNHSTESLARAQESRQLAAEAIQVRAAARVLNGQLMLADNAIDPAVKRACRGQPRDPNRALRLTIAPEDGRLVYGHLTAGEYRRIREAMFRIREFRVRKIRFENEGGPAGVSRRMHRYVRHAVDAIGRLSETGPAPKRASQVDWAAACGAVRAG